MTQPPPSGGAGGVGALMQLPIIWNPHDPASSLGAVGAGPTQFRVVADSAAPDQVPSGFHDSDFVYAQKGSNSYQAKETQWNDPTGAKLAHTFTQGNTEIDFTITSAGSNPKPLFPEPTMLVRPKAVTDPNGNVVTVSIGSGHLMKSDPLISSSMTGGGLPNYFINGLNMQGSEIQDPPGTAYIGFYMGAFPLKWTPPTGAAVSADYVFLARATGGMGGEANSCYFTYRMQYRDPSDPSGWVTYDTKYGKVAHDFTRINIGAIRPSLICGNSGNSGYWAMATDPRTSRFGLLWNYTYGNKGSSSPEGSAQLAVPLPGQENVVSIYPAQASSMNNAAGWLDTANGTMYSIRADAQAGFFAMQCWPSTLPAFNLNSGQHGATGWMAAICGWGNNKFPGLCPGLLSQNNTDILYTEAPFYGEGAGGGTHPPNYFADPDALCEGRWEPLFRWDS